MAFPDIPLKASYTSADDRVNGFFVPLLSEAITYDRVSGYFRSSSLASVSRGLARFLARPDAHMRLIVGADLTDYDLRAIESGTSLSDTLERRWLTLDPLSLDADTISRRRLEVLSWLVAEKRLEIRVGVPVNPMTGIPLRRDITESYFHAKYGILTDEAGNRVAFDGSNNETNAGLESNFEAFSVFPSWRPEVWAWNGTAIEQRFVDHWEGRVGDFWTVLPLPEAVAADLVNRIRPTRRPPALDPEEPGFEAARTGASTGTPTGTRGAGAGVGADPHGDASDPASDAGNPLTPPGFLPSDDREALDAIFRAPTEPDGAGIGIATSGVELWPHQTSTVLRMVETYPRSYLLADEVGLGKTLEVGGALRELLVTGRISRALLLVPPSVIRQWQEELADKFALHIPRLDHGKLILRLDGKDVPVLGSGTSKGNTSKDDTPKSDNPWESSDLLLASSYLARHKRQRSALLDARPWDVVVVDEAHHARSEPSKREATQMLSLLRDMRHHERWDALWLATATPMQMHAHEAWDLLDLLGLYGRWAGSSRDFERYYDELRKPFEDRDWAFLRDMLADAMSDPDMKTDPALDRWMDERADLPKTWSSTICKFHTNTRAVPLRNASAWPDSARDAMTRWLLRNTPMRERAFRATRSKLRQYKERGLLDATVPERDIEDVSIQMTTDERLLYDRIEDYIVRHYDAYREDDKTRALGFVMTLYRRRLTSSFAAVRASLERRRNNLSDAATVASLMDDDDKAAAEGDSRFETLEEVALRMSPEDLAAEIRELDDFIAALDKLPGDESKMKHLTARIGKALAGGEQTVIIFTQYGDTMRYVAGRLSETYGTQVACWSGDGGMRYNHEATPGTDPWYEVPKPELLRAFREGKDVKVLVGTDSMSEGLNLQTSGYLVNYDLPWNVMRVEQRIGRADRIGGKPVVKVVNYLYEDTIEEQILSGIGEGHSAFTYIVGDAQPVVASLESEILRLAMRQKDEKRKQLINEVVAALRGNIDNAGNRPLKLSDIESDMDDAPELNPTVTLPGLERVLIASLPTSKWFRRHPFLSGVWVYTDAEGVPHAVTFRREVADEVADVALFTYLHPLFEELRERVLGDR